MTDDLKDHLRRDLTDALVALGIDRARAIGLLELHVQLGVALSGGARAFARHGERTCEHDPGSVTEFARYLFGALPAAEFGHAARAPVAPSPHAAHRRHVTSAF